MAGVKDRRGTVLDARSIRTFLLNPPGRFVTSPSGSRFQPKKGETAGKINEAKIDTAVSFSQLRMFKKAL
jgi:hypothetical protein